jgi:hypothetical protein
MINQVGRKTGQERALSLRNAEFVITERHQRQRESRYLDLLP